MTQTEEPGPETTRPAATGVAEANQDVGLGSTADRGVPASDRRQPDADDEGLW